MQWKKERREVIRFAKRTYKKQLVTGLSGNLSLRVNEDFIIITPRAKCYEKLSLEDLVILDLNGNIIDGQKEPSSEKNLHLEIYRVREDVRAIIHTHSSYASVFAALQIPIPVILDEQTEILGGTIAVTHYAPSGSLELAKEAAKTLNKSKAILLAKHGAVAVGSSLVEAFHVCELVEKLSKIYLFMKLVQEKIPFSR